MRAAYTAGPGIFWTAVFIIIPMLSVLAISFMTRGSYGEVTLPLTLDNYKRFFGFGAFGFNPLYLQIILRSLTVALFTTLLCTICALPLAFYIASLSRSRKTIALVLVTIPFWTNLLIRTYAWQILLSANGIFSVTLSYLGLIDKGTALYPGLIAVYIGTVCDYLPYLVLPLYASVEKIDWSIVEAATDLGAKKFAAFRHAILPQIIPGLATGITLVFIPASAQFVVPDLLGAAKTSLLGNVLAQQFGSSRDWPFGAAVAVSSIILLMVGVYLYNRNKKGGLI